MLNWTRHTGVRACLAAVSMLAIATACSKPAETPAATEAAAPAPKAADNPAWPQATAIEATKAGFSAEGLAALEAAMAKSVADGDVAGMVTLLARHGEVAQFKAYGVQSGDPKTGTPMTTDSLFRIYSMTKPLTGVAMMQLYEQGKWQLDDPVSKHIPGFENMKRLSWKDGKVEMKGGQPVLVDATRPPTMRELMSHTAGLAYGLCCTDAKGPNFNPSDKAYVDQGVLASANLDEMMTKIEGIPLLYDPGTRWSYSVAVDVQGYLVQKLSGQKFGDYMKEHVFTPLGMTDTSFFVREDQKGRFTDVYHWEKNQLVMNPTRPDRPGFDDPNRLESGGGGLVSSTHDYARFCQMMLNKGELGGARLLKPESIDLMTQNHIGDLGLYSDGTTANPGQPGIKFGLDFAVVDDPAAASSPQGKGTYYWGGAAGTWFWIDPANDLFFIGMIQRMGPARPDGMSFRPESAKLVYAAISDAAAAPAAAATAPATEGGH
jgi:CubicO group peptidase (beta-lactamase class C family)